MRVTKAKKLTAFIARALTETPDPRGLIISDGEKVFLKFDEARVMVRNGEIHVRLCKDGKWHWQDRRPYKEGDTYRFTRLDGRVQLKYEE
jgi:hypothetical protein